MVTFCAGCAGSVAEGAVLRGGWLFCSIECARRPGAAPPRPEAPGVVVRPVAPGSPAIWARAAPAV